MRFAKLFGLSLGFALIAFEMTAYAAEIMVTGDRLTGRGVVVAMEDGTTAVFTAAHLVAGNPNLRIVGGDGMTARIKAVSFYGDHDIAGLDCEVGRDVKFQIGDYYAARDCVYVGCRGVIRLDADRHRRHIVGPAIKPGDSGGAVLDLRGGIVAVLTGNIKGGGVAIMPLSVVFNTPPRRFSVKESERAAASLAAFTDAVAKLRTPPKGISPAEARLLVDAAARLDVGDDPADGPVGALRRSEARQVLTHAAAYFERMEQ